MTALRLALAPFALAVALLATSATAIPAPAAAAAFQGFSCDLRAVPNQWAGGEGPTDRTAYAVRATGTVRAVMLYVDFPSAPTTETTRELFDRLAVPGSAWFGEASNGRMTLAVDSLDRWLRLPDAAKDFDTSTGAGQHALMTAAVKAADSRVDFRRYSLVYVVASAKGARFNSPAFITATPEQGIRADGTWVRYGATFGSDVRGSDEWGGWILTHETGHTLGLPDLYRLDPPAGASYHPFIANWDLMGDLYTGGNFMQWHRRKLGWLKPAEVACARSGAGGQWALHPAAHRTGTQLIAIPTSASTVVTVEQRAKVGLDSERCDSGVLVTRVNSRIASGKGPIRVVPASKVATDCGHLGHAAFARGEGERCSIVVDGIRIEVVAQAAETSTVRVRPASAKPDPRVASCV